MNGQKLTGKQNDIADDLRLRGVICMSRKYIKWAKKYLARASRRKERSNENGL